MDGLGRGAVLPKAELSVPDPRVQMTFQFLLQHGSEKFAWDARERNRAIIREES